MKSVFRAAAMLGVSALAALTAPAAAQSIGDRVTCTAAVYVCSGASATVGSGIEFGYGPTTTSRFLNLDFSNDLLTISGAGLRVQYGSGQSISFRDTTSAFTSAFFQSATGTTLTAADVTFSNGLLTIAVGGRTIDATGRITIGLTTAASVTPAPVPEPATWAMMILGFGMAGIALRRRAAVRVRFA